MSKSNFFNAAKTASELSTYDRVKIGCVLTYKGKIFSTGFNCEKTHPIQKLYNSARFSEDTPHKMHAETNALVPFLKHDIVNKIDWKHVEVYTYRGKYINGVLTTGMARPCQSCMKLIKNLGIRKIHYTTDDGVCCENINQNFLR